jgi:hypothetical protein
MEGYENYQKRRNINSVLPYSISGFHINKVTDTAECIEVKAISISNVFAQLAEYTLK